MAYIKKSDRKVTAKVMTKYFIQQYYFNRPRYEAVIPNCYPTSRGDIHGYYWGECDLLCVRKSGYTEEIELKISKADLKNEDTKTVNKGYTEVLKHETILSGEGVPNYFSYLFPKDLVDYNTIPDKYGIYEFWFTSHTGYVREVRKPKLIHRKKDETIVANIKDKGYIRYIKSVVKEK